MKKKIVYICSPLRGDYAGNQQRAKEYCLAALNAGYIPIAPHIYFTAFLDDNKAEERAQGIAAGLELLKMCQELWVYIPPDGQPSEGMRQEIEYAQKYNIKIIYKSGGNNGN